MRAVKQLHSTFVLVALAAILQTTASKAAQDHFGPVVEHARPSVLLIRAGGCPAGLEGEGETREGTGFLWHEPGLLVTALHVVAGCQTLTAYSESAHVRKPATLFRVYKEGDLAVLRAQGLSQLPLLASSAIGPTVSEQVELLGYELNIPQMGGHQVNVDYGAQELRGSVPPAVQQEIYKYGFPSLGIQITHLNFTINHGMSGAPVLDEAGNVVAIADGGLENGAVGISWALPAHYLNDLASSSEPLSSAAVNQEAPHVFAADIEQSNGPSVNCGSVSFTQVRTADFQAISHSTDDPKGLTQLVAPSPFDPKAFRFDIYRQLQSGATFVVPAGSTVQSGPVGCLVELAAGSIEMKIATAHFSDAWQAQQASVQYESSVLPFPGWQIDPAWSYPAPVQRFDGLGVRRKALVRYYQPYGAPPFSTEYFFETLAVRGGVFLGVSAVDHQWNPQVLQRQQACRMAPGYPGCSQTLSQLREWVQSILSVHLATFPVD